MSTLPMNKRKQKKLQDAAQLMENATADAFASLWYFENDSEYKGSNWGYGAIQKATKALADLKLLIERNTMDNHVSKRNATKR